MLPVGDNAEATAFALQPDDRALLGGPALFHGEERCAVARLTTQGTPDGGRASDNPNHGEFAAARYFGR